MYTNPCHYCDSTVNLVSGKEVYPHRSDLYNKSFYKCGGCKAYVGCHPDSTKPLGIVADKDLRILKSQTHDVFDYLWKSRKMSRKEAYARLAKDLKIEVELCHVGLFDTEMCKKAIEASRVIRSNL